MSAESICKTVLFNASGVTAIVGSGTATRIYPDFLAEEIALPAIVYQRAGTEYLNVIHGGIPVEQTATIDCYCMAAKRIDAEALADEVVSALGLADLLIVDRRQDWDGDTATFITIVTCTISTA